jgi:hypothetical protein
VNNPHFVFDASAKNRFDLGPGRDPFDFKLTVGGGNASKAQLEHDRAGDLSQCTVTLSIRKHFRVMLGDPNERGI